MFAPPAGQGQLRARHVSRCFSVKRLSSLRAMSTGKRSSAPSNMAGVLVQQVVTCSDTFRHMALISKKVNHSVKQLRSPLVSPGFTLAMAFLQPLIGCCERLVSLKKRWDWIPESLTLPDVKTISMNIVICTVILFIYRCFQLHIAYSSSLIQLQIHCLAGKRVWDGPGSK